MAEGADGERGGPPLLPPRLEIVEPRAGMPLFGELEVALRVEGIDAAQVEELALLLDGERVATLREPPFALTLDAGEPPGAKKLVVRARLRDGRVLESERVGPYLPPEALVSVRLVNVPVVVLDEEGRPLGGLRAADFSVREERRRVSITRFSEERSSLSLVLVLDVSRSMKGARLEALKQAARAVIESLEEDDALGFVAFDDELRLVAPPTRHAKSMLDSLEALEARGGTALYDAIVRGANLAERGPPGSMRALLVLSDGRDAARVGWEPASRYSFEEAVHATHDADAAVYVLGLGDGLERERAIEREETTGELLAELAASTGGRFRAMPAEESGALSEAFLGVLNELRHAYLLGYEPGEARGESGWRRLEVEVRRDDARVRARAGRFLSPLAPRPDERGETR